MVLEGQGSIFFSYSHHNVSVIEGQTCLVLFSKAHFKLTLPHLSWGLLLVHFTLGLELPTPASLPPCPEAWQRWGLSNSTLCASYPDPAPPQSQPYGPCIS